MAQNLTAGSNNFLSSINSTTAEVAWYDKEVKFSDLSQKVIENLSFLIKRNKRLQHVNLSNTGLTEYMIVAIGRNMRRAKSLLSIHLCQNKGATPRVKEYLQSRIRCVPTTEKIKFSPSEIIDGMQMINTEMVLKKQLSTGKEEDGEKPIARETIKVKQNMERKRIFSLVNEFSDDTATDSKMIFTRILGHKEDMPGSGQWRLIQERHEECWVCDQEVMGITFWDPDHISRQAYYSTKRV